MYPIYAYGSEEQKHALAAAHGRGQGDRLLRPDRAARRLGSGQHEDAARGRMAATGSSTARRCGSPTATIADICASCWAQTEEGIRGFIVEKGMPGFAAREIEHKFSLRASVTVVAVLRQRARARSASGCPTSKGLKGPLSLPDAGALRHHLGRRSARRRPAWRSCSTTPKEPRTVRPPAGGEPGHPGAARRHGARHHDGADAGRCSSAG